MPYEFVYKINDTDHVFRCNIETVQCEALKPNGDRCQRVCAIGTPYCYSHLLAKKKLRIKPSGNPLAGKGLFAQNRVASAPLAAASPVVFKKGQTIIEYTGDNIDAATLKSRYDLNARKTFTAPYAYVLKKDESYIDSACNRGVGSLVNHKSFSKANAKFVTTKTNGVATGIRLDAKKDIKNNTEIFASYGSSYRMKNKTNHTTTRRHRRRGT